MTKRQRKAIKKELRKELNIDFRVSGEMNELIRNLHNTYPGTERSGMAKVEKREGYYILTDIRFPKQENTSGTTDMTEGGMDVLERVIEEDPQGMQDYCCRLHSHHGMGCFWSGTDEAAKNSFNDGNTKFFFSVVTAYDHSGNINYKCALNIFKPINVEFDIPVTVEELDYEKFYLENVPNYATLGPAIEALEAQRDEKLARFNREGIIGPENISEVIQIMNVEDNEVNQQIVFELLSEQNRAAVETLIEYCNKEFDESKEELIACFEGEVFSEKLKELKDNIVAKTYLPGSAYRSDYREKMEEAGRKMHDKGDTPLWDALPGGADDDRSDQDEEWLRKRKDMKGYR